jgi:S-formylglutathione hydrolase
MKLREQHKTFGGYTEFWTHDSELCQAPMNFAVYRPPQAADGPVPILYYLSGLTCSEENFILKAGAQRIAAELGLFLVVNDTSPRGVIPGEDESEYLGSGAGYYIDATETPWAKHYQMYSYVTQELPALIHENFPVDASRESIMGHSMGGHGALTVYLKNQQRYRSVSAMAPISAPTLRYDDGGGFPAYLGKDKKAWADYDAHLLVEKRGSEKPLLFCQGADDELIEFLMPDKFVEAAKRASVEIDYRLRPGYGHNYFYVQSFIEEHLRWHAKALLA